ncbi:DUF4244 domain-containing protein [Bifidobacterium sp.]|jgi:hypothetical protein|uniref:DUF4244 domain-containing protein n=1 Tax=Bifidobacterium sp. TaxID=41200 RepID=UPI0025C11688|nr:DUF4244 domain-containing protein [Bifidobacterium sp.]MCH4209089.1 DUF4244 domain-containing protein [Bifidobacterium sp.]MCI1224730.1 DUF4244 domain-containing protein [Bifidobacterium sp.]
MNTEIPITSDGQAGVFQYARDQMAGLLRRARREAVLFDANVRTLAGEADEGAATAEYAVVLVAATGFAAVLVALLKSDAIRTLLSNLVKKALNVG